MKDSLSRIAPVVDHHPVSARIEPEFFSERLRDKEQMSDELPVGVLDTVNVPNMFFRDDQNMGRRLGIYVRESKGVIVLVQEFCGDLFFDDLAEDAVLIVSHTIFPPRPA